MRYMASIYTSAVDHYSIQIRFLFLASRRTFALAQLPNSNETLLLKIDMFIRNNFFKKLKLFRR